MLQRFFYFVSLTGTLCALSDVLSLRWEAGEREKLTARIIRRDSVSQQ